MTEALPIGVGHNLVTKFDLLCDRVEQLAEAAKGWDGIIEVAGRSDLDVTAFAQSLAERGYMRSTRAG